jgi:N-acetylmuramic acid 6-phosphate etherase
VTVNPGAVLREFCDVFIAPEVGPEALAGSTRLKAGTAQKLVLNMISTGVMLRLGRVEGNLMADLRPSCGKLQDRALRLVMRLSGAGEAASLEALSSCDGQVRAAVERLKAG